MKVVALISGGKDSCYAMMRCLDYGHEIVALANLHPIDDSIDELDSFMYQTVGHQIVQAYAKCMGLPLFRRKIRGVSRSQDLRYLQTCGDEVEDLFLLLKEIKTHFPTIGGVSSGAIASDYQRLRVENVCSRLGLVSLAFLWKQEQTDLLQKMISSGIKAVLVKVAALGLKPYTHLGKTLAEMQQCLIHLNSSFGINLCGEGGEYETLTLDCPLFKNFQIVLDAFEIVLHSPDNIAPVGVLHPSKFHLECKVSEQLKELEDQEQHVYDVDANSQELPDNGTDTNLNSIAMTNENSKLECSAISCRSGSFITVTSQVKSISNAFGIGEELGIVLASITDELVKDGIGWGNALCIHLYINDMSAFAIINEAYMQVITEKRCAKGVPCRSTVELALARSGMGQVIVEVIAAKDLDKKVLHVQSISCWAPSCIGPYSQATFRRGMLFMAGQLGLDPPTMVLVSGGAASEMKQAIQNCEAVAQAFSASIFSSSISLIIYCSSSVSLAEIQEAEIVLRKSWEPHKEGNGIFQSLPILYVLVPALPKGAIVEVEPFVHVPLNNERVNGNSSIQRLLPSKACQCSVILGCTCRALFSLSRPEHCSLSSEISAYIKEGLKLGLQTFSDLLSQASLDWANVLAVRVMFIADKLSYSSVVEYWKDAIDEFAISLHITSSKSAKILRNLDPLFLPVLGLGRDTHFEGLVTVDLLAAD